MSRKNIQRDIDVVKTSVWDVVDATSLRPCEDVSFKVQRTDQIETFSRRIQRMSYGLPEVIPAKMDLYEVTHQLLVPIMLSCEE